MIVKETTSTKSPIYEDALSIRHEVFITEQNVPFEREIEGEEGKQYFVGYVGTTAAVCARVFLESPGIWHVQRVACREEYRGKHLASELMRFIEERASDSGINLITLGAQDQAAPFYERLGFKTIGEGFFDAGIPHHRMDKEI